MHPITGQTDLTSSLSKIDYDLPFEAGTSEYRGVAELIIVFFNEVK